MKRLIEISCSELYCGTPEGTHCVLLEMEYNQSNNIAAECRTDGALVLDEIKRVLMSDVCRREAIK